MWKTLQIYKHLQTDITTLKTDWNGFDSQLYIKLFLKKPKVFLVSFTEKEQKITFN